MNQYTVEMYKKGFLKGCPECGCAGILTIGLFKHKSEDGHNYASIFGRVCSSCGFQCEEIEWNEKGRVWNGKFGNEYISDE